MAVKGAQECGLAYVVVAVDICAQCLDAVGVFRDVVVDEAA